MATRILIVDDETIIRESLSFVLQKEGYEVSEASNGAEAFRMHEKQPFDVVISDIEMPEMRGIELLEQITQRTPETFVLMVTAFGSIETAVQALRKGAYDYILKPIDFDDLLHRVKKLLDHRALALDNSLLRQELNRSYDFHSIIGQSMDMKKVFEMIKRISQSDATVLISGKSGTGKELVARAIHYNGVRKHRRFVAVNCGAIVDTLFESELFGHKKGSFTGATTDKDGLITVADGGTIFLDEVGELPLAMQVKLLRAIEQKEITPVGKTEPIHIDVRVIAATNKNLKEEVEQSRFREDLYYRLNVVEIHLPSLSERPTDIPLLANHFLDIYRKQMNKPVKGFTNEAMAALVSYKWKGEVRELENVVERAIIFCDQEMISAEHLPESFRALSGVATNLVNGESLKDAVKQFERDFIQRMLTKHDANKEETAKALGISLSSLYRKMEELGIPR
jgi:two-component system response regulator PilR (NtrC family)